MRSLNLDEARTALNAGDNVGRALRRVWHLLDGGEMHGMEGSKLDRIENAHWRDPIATFTIERHGKPDGESQTWRVDLAEGAAVCKAEHSLRPPAAPQPSWDERAVAAELATLVRAGKDDPRLRWQGRSRRSVKVMVSRALPEGSTPATPAQAARLNAALGKELGDAWVREAGLWVRTDRD